MEAKEFSSRNTHHRQPPHPSPTRVIHSPVLGVCSLSASGDCRDSSITEQGIVKKYLDLRTKQDFALNSSSNPQIKRPTTADFGKHLSNMYIMPPHNEKDLVENAVIVLHDFGQRRGDPGLNRFSRDPLRQSRTVYLYPQGPYPALVGDKGARSWAEPAARETFAEIQANSATNDNFNFWQSSKILLEDIIRDGLIKNCSFSPTKIVIIGQGQGGMVALASVAAWNLINFGGVISIGMPTFVAAIDGNQAGNLKVDTPAMIFEEKSSLAESAQWQKTKALFRHVEKVVLPGKLIVEPGQEVTRKEWQPLLDFYAHRLRREEWSKQSIITFDGGGIRGYGSLLILRQLMLEIGDEEALLGAEDGLGESSFAPCEYKPRAKSSLHDGDFEPSPTTRMPTNAFGKDGISDPVPLPNSSLFLPCHYFNYVGGTSTGGLIAIMLGRLRMTVDDCIKEYETLGEAVFGNPRPPSMKGLLWHKFNSDDLRQVIENVTRRRAEIQNNGQVMYPCPWNRCQTVVLAYSDKNTSETPYLWRTYNTQANQGRRITNKATGFRLCNGGNAQNVPIADVGRATSAAPNFFRPAVISIGNEERSFKDGGFGSNNPSYLTYVDVILKHGNMRTCIGPFVSIGTGNSNVTLFDRKQGGWLRNRHFRDWRANLQAALRLPSRTQGAHENMQAASAKGSDHHFPYLRLDGGDILGSIKLDEWESNHRLAVWTTGKDATPGIKTLEKIRGAVARYLVQDEVRTEIKKMAKILVQRRRLRTRDKSAWDQYACASHYECSIDGCVKERIETLCEYMDHVRSQHRDEKAHPQSDRRCWIYRD